MDVELFQLGLHNDPSDLRARLQEQIDATTGQGYDAIVLAYGLCDQATAGLIARDIPLVIPRAHDCIKLSWEIVRDTRTNLRITQALIGTPWITQKDSAGTTLSLGSGLETDMNAVYDEYVEKYGAANADYLMEVMGVWQSHYQRAVFIDMGVGDGTPVEAVAQSEATRRGWNSERVSGDLVLIRRLLECVTLPIVIGDYP